MVPALCSLLLSALPVLSAAESDSPPVVPPPPLPMDRYQVDNGGDVSCPASVDMGALQQARQVTLTKYSALKEAESFEVFSAKMRTLWDVEDENIKVIIPQAGTYVGIEKLTEYITLVVGSINGGYVYYYGASTSNFKYFPTNSSYAFQVNQKVQHLCTVPPSPTDPGVCDIGEMDSLALHHITWKPCTALISQYVIAYNDQMNYYAKIGMTLPSLCNRHQRYCTGENQQYVDFIDCMSFMESIPTVSCKNAIFNGNNSICRFKHSFMAQFNPAVHCPHLGKVTDVCTDEDCGGDLTCDGKPGETTYTAILPDACSKDCGAQSRRNPKFKKRNSRRNLKSKKTKSSKNPKSSKSAIGEVNTSRCASSWN